MLWDSKNAKIGGYQGIRKIKPDSLYFFGYINEPPSRTRTAIEKMNAATPIVPSINSIKDILKFALIILIASNIL